MTRLVLKGLAARKLRSALTAVAVFLGVAMIAGTYVETDQISQAFEDITASSVENLDVVVSPKEEFTASFGGEVPDLPASTADRVARVPGVEAAEAGVTAIGNIVVDGEVVDTLGAPGLVIGWGGDERFDPTRMSKGRPPQRGEVSVLEQNAIDNGIEVGDTIGVVTRHGVRDATVSGIFEFGEGGSALGGTTVVEAPTDEVREWFDLKGRATSIGVIATVGVPSEVLADRIDTALGGSAKVQTASENAQESSDQVNDQIGSFLNPALLALAGAAVLVGAFIIFNTFSITVAQRTREFALLRALGSTRRQILAVVSGEALVIGLIATALGLLAGLGFAKVLNALFDAVGFGIPRTGLVLEPRTVIVAAIVGVGVTLLAALIPAIRATRVSPVAAMSRAPSRPSARARRLSAAVALLCSAVGIAITARGLLGSGSATATLGAVAFGAILIFIGVALSARYLVRPMAAVIGWPIQRLFGEPGRLARENSERNPGRTATTAGALMVGLALVVFVSVFANALKASISDQIDDFVRADLIVYNQDFRPMSARAAELVADVPGVKVAQAMPYDQLEVDGEKSNAAVDVLIGVDPAKLPEVYAFDWIDGDDSTLDSLGAGETLVEEQFAKAHDLEIGTSYEAVTPTGGRATLTPVGIYRDPTVLQGSLATVTTLRSISPARDPISLLVATDDEADIATVQSDIKGALASFPGLKVQDKGEYMESAERTLDQIVYLLYALLALSVVISLFGIANSLFLSVHERTREFGVLRAIGTTRNQVRRIVRYESVITSAIGGVLGTIIGIGFAWLMIESLSEFGFGLAIPGGQIAALLALAVVVGVVGAIVPAARASRIKILAALHEQ